MQVSEIGIEADLLQRAVDGDVQHPVAEGEQAVDRVLGRPAGPAGQGTRREELEAPEVVTGRASLYAEHFGQCSNAAEVGQCGGMPFSDIPQPGLPVTGGVPRGSQQQLPVVVQLPGHDRPRDTDPVLRPFVGTELRESE